MTNSERGGAASEEAFALLGHEIRLDILRAFFERYSPVDPDSRSDVREQRTLSYAELMAATEMEDSGKFNYHLEKLRDVYIEEVAEGYVPTASAIALYEAVIANRPTESIPADFDIEESCPNCESGLRGKYEQEFLTVECPACDLFWGATYRFPKNGLAVREGEGVYKALYDRMMHHVGLARTGQCPSCAGITSVTVPRERLDEDSTPTAEFTCETCSWFITVDIVSALQFEPQVTKALTELGVPLSKSSSMRATERVLPDVTGWVSSGDPFYATISITYGDAVAEITVSDDLNICSAAVE
ncbi:MULTISPECIES: DUF7351 domain-containing protein [Haloferax]|uniref:ArsR family transcriptional regulator n=3 Tax=Haloferax TaxID=2251 RepID=M0IHM0_HALVO|nr:MULTISPECIES: helix-turn-helix domain-containing protein [Haloferax]ELZ78935.1 hypothetical protein C456_01397 [Haloferax lucentense DSM 14919]ELZ95507.1 hypothetical protein C452_00075 [Haloferax alexandrinus JCM 10717]RDZ30918.1 ArsR family transcriptional regulator [Haloferax sp. Atlit-48N]RDZ38450.1 ArsR family transcriptional regulator [Haloferax sp. Atlit-47N]WEL27524.1 Putative transcriptional regulator, contains HTHdomain [Haloferax lucentense]